MFPLRADGSARSPRLLDDGDLVLMEPKTSRFDEHDLFVGDILLAVPVCTLRLFSEILI